MFGFRFSDSNYITIQCEVGILPNYTFQVNSYFATIMISKMIFKSLQVIVSYFFFYFLQSLCKKSTRKRRETENVEIKTKFAASKIRVYDNKDMYQMENKSPQKSCK